MRHTTLLAIAGSLFTGWTAHAGDQTTMISAQCEEALALSALPARLRGQASVYILKDGDFELSRTSDGPFTCIVARNHPEALIPQCADAAGANSVIPGVIMKTRWSLAGASPEESVERFDQATARGELHAPARAGVSYMMSGFNYVWNWSANALYQVPPHVMYYAPDLSNDDVGGSPQFGMSVNRGSPFVIEPGIHGYMVSMVEHPSDSDDVLAACGGQLPEL